MGVWDSILRGGGGGGGRRFIKRKDSDAGEAGRALEELRGSLYNEFHTSEGAKRQQQRFCGPSVALTFNFFVAVGIIMANKMVMGAVGFNFPVALSLIHYIAAWVLMAVLKAFYLLPIAPPSKSTPFSSLFALGAVMSFSTGLANISLKHNSVGFYQMAKIAVTPTIVAAEFILFKKKVSLRKVDVEDNPNNCVFLSCFDAIIGSSGLVVFQLEYPEQQCNHDICFWSGALALGATSALAHVVLGQFKTIVIMLSSYLVFNSDPGFTSLCGAIIALGGMSVYTYLGLKESASGGKRAPSTSRQNSHLLKSKVIVDGEKPETRPIDSKWQQTSQAQNAP
uniref:Sugar phosphate transporter domain-containing protein n=1 Tax=Oryza glumipatula TaxID=40148 RepID=A0A0E0A8G1_9ORYZ